MKYKCEACQKTQYSTISLNDYNVLECLSCGMGMVDPIPSNEKLEKLYNSAEYFAEHMSYDYSTLSENRINALIKENTSYHLKHLKRFLDLTGKKVLEIGCGGGFLLKGLQQEGAEVKGLETSNASVDFINKKLKLSVQNANFETVEFNDKFDLIILNHVLEHFVHVLPALQKIESNLNKGGLLYLRVPDFGSFDRRAYKQHWPAFLPFHIYYFTERSLQSLLKQNGLSVIYENYFFSEKFLEGYPKAVRKLALRVCHSFGLEKKFSGRTITIIARKD